MHNMYIRAILGFFVALCSYLFGGLDGLLMALIAMVILDFISGLLKAINYKELTSNKTYKGGIRKIGIFVIVAMGNIIDNALELGGLLRAMTISYFIANEGISILENWSSLGLPVPERLRKVLKQLHDKDDEKITKNFDN